MKQSFPPHPIAYVHLVEQINRTLLQYAGANALFAILAASSLDHYGMDALQVQQLRQNETRRSGADNSNLCT
jgi:hypothetical protein